MFIRYSKEEKEKKCYEFIERIQNANHMEYSVINDDGKKEKKVLDIPDGVKERAIDAIQKYLEGVKYDEVRVSNDDCLNYADSEYVIRFQPGVEQTEPELVKTMYGNATHHQYYPNLEGFLYGIYEMICLEKECEEQRKQEGPKL